MSAHRSPAAQIVADLCARFPKASSRTLAKRLHNEHPALFTSIELARNSVRTKRGNRGKRARREVGDKSLFRPNGKAGELPPLPESCDTEWPPFELDTNRCLILSDIHLPYQAPRALNAALRFGDTFKPDSILFNGDTFDFFQLSKFDKNPTLPSVAAELRAGAELFDHVHKRFPKARLVAKIGNHDQRWERYVFNSAPLLADVPGIRDGWEVPAGIARNKVQMVRDKRVIMVGKLPVLHGHELPIKSSVNPARAAWLKCHHTVLFGHFHQSTSYSPPELFHEENATWSTGCLCGLSPQYLPINSWNWGFAAVEVHGDKTFDVHNMRVEKNGKLRSS